MTSKRPVRTRKSIQELQHDYENGNKKPLENLMRAWRGIKELHPEDPQSFFMLGGYHGEPFRGAGWGNSSYWGGYCNHGNILFPTWHRVYILKLEEALQSIDGCSDVMLPYWDETSEDSVQNGIPKALTDEEFTLDGQTIPNPLRSFRLNKSIKDFVTTFDSNNPANYSKPEGYETVRYPLSGLVGTEEDRAATKAHNDQYRDKKRNVHLLNQNIVNWLSSFIYVEGKKIQTNVKQKYIDCLKAPNYTLFSNTTSAQQYNYADLRIGEVPVVSLESPHNSIHLAVGGFDIPGVGDYSPIEGANGDMGENNTAGLDPIFYFHHCFVDRVFWLWQQKHNSTEELEVIPEYPGTNSVDSQGPTPGTVPNSWLTLDSPLHPFKKEDGTAYTSRDCINIKNLGYTYSEGSLEKQEELEAFQHQDQSVKVIRVSGINRAPIRGSFLVSAYTEMESAEIHIGTEAVLSRWNTQYCANCQTHLEVKAFIPLHGASAELVEEVKDKIKIKIHTRKNENNDQLFQASDTKKLFHIEVL